MNASRRGRRGRLILIPALLLASAALAAVVTLWSLARPGADPVGDELARLGAWSGALLAKVRASAGNGAADWAEAALQVADGDPETGARLIAQYGCGACHTIPGIARARGSVGPALHGFRRQAYIAGVLPNRPGDLVNWLQSPPRYAPQTAMPDMGITEAEAEHMAAYLYTLDRR
ncbi:c-type cytochrome [Poseidonocella sedimentorum]|uniref:Cytochrome c2 n=1 Tax=Poseidonocella sedimentorum TaxID=871652 RepID=A0A1I6CVE7_9RHOB|nr:c-type cytochrome [Poseidonocella sedimentorum]SFQ97092.1 Cytochrome c2 [Poseidonocella sedimentorum]